MNNSEKLARILSNEDVTYGWYPEVEKEMNANNVKGIFKVSTKGFAGAWFVLVTKDKRNIRIQHKINDVNTAIMMTNLLDEIIFIEVDSDELYEMEKVV